VLNATASSALTTVAASVHDRRIVLLHIPSGTVFTSNHVGARIWQLAEHATPVADIAATLCREYHVAPDIAMTHTARFLAALVDHQLLDPSQVR
jgi:hypothetical protein